MYTNTLEQLKSFLIFIIIGVIISIIFDFFRTSRRVFKTSDLLTYSEDIIFLIISGLLILISIFRFNNGELRGYIFFGIAIGILIYMIFFSKYIIKISVMIINSIKIILSKFLQIILKPIKFIIFIFKKIIFKPVSFIFINFRKFIIKNTKNFKNIKIFDKKLDKKEGI